MKYSENLVYKYFKEHLLKILSPMLQEMTKLRILRKIETESYFLLFIPCGKFIKLQLYMYIFAVSLQSGNMNLINISCLLANF